MANITIINHNSEVLAHAEGCRDIARFVNKNRPFAEVVYSGDFASEREVFLDYNGDFIDDADGDETAGWTITFYPCCNLPKA